MKTHFKGKSVLEHLKEARKKGYLASKENHGIETQGHLVGGADAAKDIAIVALLLWILSMHLTLSPINTYFLLGLTTAGLFFWKVGRSACLGWARLEKINKLIEEEKHEILVHRDEEKAELMTMYQAKGFSEPLLSKVVDVLMADDNKLLGIMLEEELGVSLELYEHPLKQAAGAALGTLGAALILSFGLFALPAWGPPLCAAVIIALSAGTTAQLEKNSPLPSIVWNLAIGAVAAGAAYFLAKIIL